MTVKLALVADVHGNLPALDAVAADIARRGIRTVANLGDHLSGPLLPLETARFLMARDWWHIAGNHDRQVLDPAKRTGSDAFAFSTLGPTELEWLAALPATRTLENGVFLCHGTPRSDLEYLLETVAPGGLRLATAAEIESRLASTPATATAIACGHTHVPRAVRTQGGRLVVNPGSVGLPAYDDTLPYPHAVETGSPDARYAILERMPDGDWIVELVAVPYDHRAMAALADARGRADWAHALATGYALQPFVVTPA